MTSLGGADRAIIRMKASRAVCSRRTGVSAGRRVIGEKGPAVEIFSGNFTGASPLLPLTTMAPAHHKPLMLLSATRPTFHTMTQLLHTLTQLPLCNSQTQPPGLETSDVPLLNPPLLHQPGSTHPPPVLTSFRSSGFAGRHPAI